VNAYTCMSQRDIPSVQEENGEEVIATTVELVCKVAQFKIAPAGPHGEESQLILAGAVNAPLLLATKGLTTLRKPAGELTHTVCPVVFAK
jgi:hypothetical protein